MITVHHLAHSRSQRVLWLLEELGVPYDVIRYEWPTPTVPAAPAALKQIHPLGKSPVITDGDLTIAESGAIFEYLVETYGSDILLPKNPAERHACRYWIHYAEGSLIPPLIMRRIVRTTPHYVSRWLRPIVQRAVQRVDATDIGARIRVHLDYCDEALRATGWFVGRGLTVADLMMSMPLEMASKRADLTHYPHIRAFLERIHALPNYRKAVVRGGEYMYVA